MSTPLGHQTYLGLKGMGDNSMFGKRMVPEAVEVPIRKTRVTWRRLNYLNPRDHTVKTSDRVERLQPRLSFGCRRLGIRFGKDIAEGLGGNEPPQGPERGAYITLITSITTGRRDCLRGASPTVTETQ
jgi:hypothetical protein